MTPVLPVIGTQPAIVIAGADARPFAQSQFCGDVDALPAHAWQWNAWLTPVGKVRALMRIVDAGDGTLMLLPRGGDALALLPALQRYVMRARVVLSALEFSAHAGLPLPMGQVAGSGGTLTLGLGERSLHLIRSVGAEPVDEHARAAWRLADISAGWPTLPDGEPAFLPPALALERLGAIAFDKGCYPGQEIAARLHFRGGHKHHLCHLRGLIPLPVGATRTADGAEGYVTDTVCKDNVCDALALVSEKHSNIIIMLDAHYRVVSSFSP